VYRLIGKIRPISLYTSKRPGESGSPRQSGSRVTGVPGRVGSRVSVTDPVPTLPRIHSWKSNFCIIRLLYRFVCLFVCFWLMLKCKDTGCCGGADICQEGRPDTRYRTWNAPRQFVIPHRDSATSWCANLRSPSMRLRRKRRPIWCSWSVMTAVCRSSFATQRRQWSHKARARCCGDSRQTGTVVSVAEWWQSSRWLDTGAMVTRQRQALGVRLHMSRHSGCKPPASSVNCCLHSRRWHQGTQTSEIHSVVRSDGQLVN